MDISDRLNGKVFFFSFWPNLNFLYSTQDTFGRLTARERNCVRGSGLGCISLPFFISFLGYSSEGS